MTTIDALVEAVARAIYDDAVEIGMNATPEDGLFLARAALAAIEASGTHVIVPFHPEIIVVYPSDGTTRAVRDMIVARYKVTEETP